MRQELRYHLGCYAAFQQTSGEGMPELVSVAFHAGQLEHFLAQGHASDTHIETPGSQSIETRRLAAGHQSEQKGVMKFGIPKRIRIVRNTIYSRSGGVTLAIQES